MTHIASILHVGSRCMYTHNNFKCNNKALPNLTVCNTHIHEQDTIALRDDSIIRLHQYFDIKKRLSTFASTSRYNIDVIINNNLVNSDTQLTIEDVSSKGLTYSIQIRDHFADINPIQASLDGFDSITQRYKIMYHFIANGTSLAKMTIVRIS